jgi:hypothetical protein
MEMRENEWMALCIQMPDVKNVAWDRQAMPSFAKPGLLLSNPVLVDSLKGCRIAHLRKFLSDVKYAMLRFNWATVP